MLPGAIVTNIERDAAMLRQARITFCKTDSSCVPALGLILNYLSYIEFIGMG
jgi:hypothetical protein